MALTRAPFSSGQMTHRVTIYKPENAFDAAVAGNLDTGVPARIVALDPPFQRREEFAAGGLAGQTVYTIVIRYREDLRRDHQLREECCTERTFHIAAIQPSDRGDALICTCVVGER